MTNKEAIEILKEEHKYVQEPCYVTNAIAKAIEALRRTESSKPLTLEQMREMVNDPDVIGHVVTVYIRGVKCNGILDERTDDGICVSTGANSAWLKEKDYGKTWFAYAYPPAHINRDAWTAEWIPFTDDDGCLWFECSSCEYDLDSLDERPMFCPGCGRAMTEEAWKELEKRVRGEK